MDIASKELVIAGWALVIVYSAVILFFVVRGALKIKTLATMRLAMLLFLRLQSVLHSQLR
jgi:hypothetical protein